MSSITICCIIYYIFLLYFILFYIIYLYKVKPYNIRVTLSFPPDTDTPGFQEENVTKVYKYYKI